MSDQPQVQEVKEGEAKPEEGKAQEAAAAPKASNPLIPVIIMLVMMPVLSFVMTDFVLIPRMKGALEKVLTNAVDAAKHAPTSESETHGEAGHELYTRTFKNIVANLAGSMQSRYIKISFTLESNSPSFEEVMDANEAKIVDAALGILSSLTIGDLEKPGIQNIIRSDLLTAFTNVLRKDIVTQIYFSEFVIQ